MNPGKRFYLKLAADVFRTASAQRDKESVLHIRKAMIRCGMSLNLNGFWEERQLSPELKKIIKNYPSNFNGEVVSTNHGLEGEEKDSESD